MKNRNYIGCSGYAVGFWKGIFYPQDLSSKEYLNFYSKKLSAVEINSTFYRKPRPATLEKWVQETNNDFKFFIKIPKAISHHKKLENTKIETTGFCSYISRNLKNKLAGFLFQLPPSFHYTEENLQKVLDTVDEQYLNVFEFRHASWWIAKVQEKLKSKNIVFAGVSIPKDIPDDFVINNEDFCYYRLHGIPQMFKSEYSYDQLDTLANSIKNFNGISYVFFNNTFGPAAIKNAYSLKVMAKNRN